MSKYDEYKTDFRDGAALCAVLRDTLGFEVEYHAAEPVTCYDYHGIPRPEKANIIIRRQNTGIEASNDVGFRREADGTFTAIISDYDRSCKFDEAWVARLRCEYGIQQDIQAARVKGYVYQGRKTVEVNGREKVKLVFAVR